MDIIFLCKNPIWAADSVLIGMIQFFCIFISFEIWFDFIDFLI